jgi:hypothetical protein
MIIYSLSQFDLHFPSHWIEGQDRDWAGENARVLRQVENLFIEAVAAYSLFRPITADSIKDAIRDWGNESPYERCLNGLYAKAFVFALDGIQKFLSRLCEFLAPPQSVRLLYEEYKREFGHLKHIRDSAIHIEDRGRGMKKPCGRGEIRSQERVNTPVILLGCFSGTSITNRFTFTGENGKQYEVEISDTTLFKAKEIIQKIINAYPWVPNFSSAIEEIIKQASAGNVEDDLSGND